ncbi:MAG: potassium/proton antiporter [Bacteroidaceae bacterium]|nr:potassium/proton antiporter [Bacteroidaceae bacterium]
MEEIISLNTLMIAFALSLFISILVTKAGAKYGIPTLVLFLGVGILFGKDGLFGIEFEDYKYVQDIGSIALCIILFGGGMGTQFKNIRPVIAPGVALATVAVVITTLITGTFVWWLSGMEWTNIHFPIIGALLCAATMSSTDSASVFAILRERNINLKHNLCPMLELESGSNDPIAFMMTILLIDICTRDASGVSWWAIGGNILCQFGLGTALGWLFGRGSSFVINRMKVSNPALYPIMLISLIFFTYAITDLCNGNPYLAVYIAGIMVGNGELERRQEIAQFLDVTTWLMQIYMFTILGLIVVPSEMLLVAPVALIIGVFMIFVARPLSVFITMLPFKYNFRSKAFISWVGLRGASPIIFSIYPVVAGVEEGKVIFNIVFFITLLSLLLQGMSLSKVADWLGLALPEEEAADAVKEDK